MSHTLNRMVTLRKTNMNKAKKRAQQSGPGIFNGEEALAEVAKQDGLWNWALVASDPETLPLSGGGMGSVDEMREAIGKHAHSFGLLRMTFNQSGNEIHKWMFIHASDPIDSGNYSAVERGQAMALVPLMDKAIHRFVAVAGKVHVQSKEECTVENLVNELRTVVRGVDAEIITVANFQAAVAAHKEANPQSQKQEQLRTEKEKIIEQLVTPISGAVAPESDTAVPDNAPKITEETRQRKRVKLYAKGDQVDVYSVKHKKWFNDAEVTEVTKEGKEIDGHRVRAGSMKVVYDNGSRFKWVAPQQMEELMRPSLRPRPPEAVVGNLLKETNSWFGAKYASQYCELNKGFLQWWEAQADAERGAFPEMSIYLMGLQLQEDPDGTSFRLRSDHSGGAIFGFKAESEDEAQVWVEMFWAHAWFCEEMRDYTMSQKKKMDMGKELLNVMQAKLQKE